MAVEKTIEYTDWDCRFELYVDAQDTWQVGTQLEVLVRLTLVQKGIDNYDYKPWDGATEFVTSLPEGVDGRAREFVSLSVVGGHIIPFRPSDRARWGTLYYYAPVNLTEDGDYWERQFRLDMHEWSVGYLGRGETDNATLHVGLYLAEYDANHTLLNELYVGGNNSTVGIAVFRPLLSTTETYVVGGVGSVMAIGLLAFALQRLGRLCRWGYHSWRDHGNRVVVRWREPRVLGDPSRPRPVSKLRKESTVMSGRKCRFCGLHQERKFIKNEDGEWEVAGWESADLAAEP